MNWTLDPNALALAGVLGLTGFAFGEMRKPGKRQEQLMLMALAGIAAYALRQFEGRGHAQETQGLTLTALSERIATLFNRMQKAESAQQEHADDVAELRSEVRVVTRSVDELVKRMDKYFETQVSARRR